MLNKQYVLFVFLSLHVLMIQATNPLNPGAPVQVTFEGGNNYDPVAVGTAEGFLLIYGKTDEFFTNFSTDQGATWPTGGTVSTANYDSPWVASRYADGIHTYMAVADSNTIGGTNALGFSISTDQGTTWGAFTFPDFGIGNEKASPSVSSNADGFMVAWNDNDNLYASFTSDNGTTWTTPFQISSTNEVNGMIILGVNTDGFMASWTDDGAAFTSFTSNNVTTWSTPFQISSNSASDVWVAGNTTGFIATWVTDANEAYSIKATIVDGAPVWGTPVLISSLLSGGTNVSIFGAPSGFVTAWIDIDDNAYANFTTGSGDYTWSDAVQITTTFAVNGGIGTDLPFVDVTCFEDQCLFSWKQTDANIYTSFSRLPASIQPPTNLTGSQQKNNFGLVYELCNTLQWRLSVSTNVAGYHVYANGNLIATVSASATEYQDNNQLQGVSIVYSIKSFDADGNESAAATVTVS